jgi:ABC-2 type transport system permease protein
MADASNLDLAGHGDSVGPDDLVGQGHGGARTVSALAVILRKETKYEFLKLLRTRQFSLATIGFPVMFYTLFGLSNHKAVYGNFQVAKYLMGGYACFGLVGAALFGIGVGMAAEINAGWLEVKRASPMPPMAYLFAKCVAAIAFGLIIVSILIVLGVRFGGVSVTAGEVVRMLGVSVAGSMTFASMGLLLAQLVAPSAAPGIVNLFYLPMSFLSGLWIPLHRAGAADLPFGTADGEHLWRAVWGR